MRITVEDCLNLDAFKGSTVISCKRKMDRRVRTISVFDEIDYEKGIERNGVKEQMVLIIMSLFQRSLNLKIHLLLLYMQQMKI